MPTITLPDPSLVLLVGAAGSGKTTFAARHFAPDEVLSSDAFRALLSGDEADQSVSRGAFAILERELERRLRAGLLTVVDATNAVGRHRHALVRRARAHGVPVVALVLGLPAEVVLARNAGRARTVDEDVIRTQLTGIDRALRPDGLATEGYATVRVFRTPAAVDAVTIERVRSAGPEGAARHDPSERSRPDLDPHPVGQVDVLPDDRERGVLGIGPEQDDR
jgi:protein phosphatase